MQYKNPVIFTKNELLTSGFRIPSRPDHNGVDFVDKDRLEATPKGVGIIAIADGMVVESINGSLVGVTVAIAHEGKMLSRYQHMRKGSVTVKVGDKVKKGQVIGIMGNTGSCVSNNTNIPIEYRGTHLHIGIKENSTAYNNGTWVDPIPYLAGAKTIGNNIAINDTPQSLVAVFAKGNKVKVKQGAKTYTGGNLTSFVYNTIYDVQQVNGDRVTIGIGAEIKGNNITAAINAKDLVRV